MAPKTVNMKATRIFWINSILGICAIWALGSNTYAGFNALWDTSHGVYLSYEPSRDFQPLVQGLASSGFNIDTTDQGFLAEDVSDYDVLVVCVASAWHSAYSAAEVSRINEFVSNGGGLLIMADNTDCPNMNIQPVASSFGVSLGQSDIIPYDTYVTNLDSHPIFDDVSQIYMRAAGEISSSGLFSEIAWQTGTGKALAAAGVYGNGRVVVLGDAGHWARSYYPDSDNELFAINTFEYLAVPEPATFVLLGLGSLLFHRKK